MKRLLLGLVPWMVVATAAAQGEPKFAEAVFTGLGEKRISAWRIADECYVPVSSLKLLGWEANVEGSRLKVVAEGKGFSLPYRTQADQPVVSLQEAAKKLGAGTSWANETVCELWAPLTSLEVDTDTLAYEAPIGIRPKISLSEKPSRIIIDLIGARLTEKTERDIPEAIRVAQHGRNVVRLIVDAEGNKRLSEREFPNTRAITLPFDGSDPKLPEKTVPIADLSEPDTPGGSAMKQTVEITETPSQEEPPLYEPSTDSESFDKELPVWKGAPIVFAGPITVLDQDGKTTTLSIQTAAPLGESPRFNRPEPSTLEIVLPGARWPMNLPFELKAQYVTKIEKENVDSGLKIRFHLARPMGLQLSSSDDGVQVTLIKPEVGDGRLAGKTIVVDAGHGGKDPGARSPNKTVREKDINLAVAKLLARQLAENGVTVIMTRKTDVFIPLLERAEIANRNNAQFFISVHVNSNLRRNSLSGSITFYHEQDPICRLLADCIQGEIAKVNRLPNLGSWSDHRIYDSGFSVLRNTTMPAVLLELGFINHATDRKRIQQPQFHKVVASAVVKGIKAYLGDGKSKN